MPWITPTEDTVIKLRPLSWNNGNGQLGTNEVRERKAQDKLGIISARPADNQHWELYLAGELSIGEIKHRKVFIFCPHWKGVGPVYQAALAITKAQHKQTRIQAHSMATQQRSGIKLPVPYLSQRDNSLNPNGSCNVTCFAMMMLYYGIAQKTGARQFEDELYRYMESNGLSRHSPHDLSRMANAYGLSNEFDSKATIEEVQGHLDSGRACITHGYFTSFGHIIGIVGYDEDGLIVHDPFGEWNSWGYDTSVSGRYLHYSYGLIERTCQTGGEFWIHFVDRKGWSPPAEVRPVAVTQIAATNTAQSTGERLLKPSEFYAVPEAVEVKKSWEGWRAQAYKCQSGVWTIGWGTTRLEDGSPVRSGLVIDKARGEALVAKDLDEFIADLQEYIDVPLKECQLAALISWQYNTGAIATASVTDAINEGLGDDEICRRLSLYNKVADDYGNLVVSQGLVNRRKSECELWRGGDWRKYR